MAITDTLYYAYSRVRQFIEEEANFFRLHLLFFTFTPLVAAGIFYAVNGEFHIREYLQSCRTAEVKGTGRECTWDVLPRCGPVLVEGLGCPF